VEVGDPVAGASHTDLNQPRHDHPQAEEDLATTGTPIGPGHPLLGHESEPSQAWKDSSSHQRVITSHCSRSSIGLSSSNPLKLPN